MEIKNLKISGQGWLANSETFVPNDPNNSDCQEVMKFIESGGVVDPEFSDSELIEQNALNVRHKRDMLLKESDYIMMPDYPLPDKSAWELYRQDLRDVTTQTGFPNSVIWPEKPTS